MYVFVSQLTCVSEINVYPHCVVMGKPNTNTHTHAAHTYCTKTIDILVSEDLKGRTAVCILEQKSSAITSIQKPTDYKYIYI